MTPFTPLLGASADLGCTGNVQMETNTGSHTHTRPNAHTRTCTISHPPTAGHIARSGPRDTTKQRAGSWTSHNGTNLHSSLRSSLFIADTEAVVVGAR